MSIEELCSQLKEDYTIVMVTHNMQQASRISDRTALFLLGVDEHATKRSSAGLRMRETGYIAGKFG